MRSKVIFSIAASALWCTAMAQAYDIAPLNRQLVGGSRWATSSHTYIKGNVYKLVADDTTAKTPPSSEQKQDKKKNKSKRQRQSSPTPTNKKYKATLTQEEYDPSEVLTNGFTITVWAVAFASTAPGHGFILYPLPGYANNGTNQSQWGFTAGNDCIRIYENYTGSSPILEYKHNEDKDFFLSIVCRDNTPILYINGKAVSKGSTSNYSPHPALNAAPQCPTALKFIGKTTMLHYFPRALTSEEILGLYSHEYPELHKTKSNHQ